MEYIVGGCVILIFWLFILVVKAKMDITDFRERIDNLETVVLDQQDDGFEREHYDSDDQPFN